MKPFIQIFLPLAFMSSLGCSTQKTQKDAAETVTAEQVSNSSSVSPDFPKEGPQQATQPAFDEFSWQMFVALNWPASNKKRGVPDRSKKLGDSGTTVWLSYKTANETFLPKAANPGTWEGGYPIDKKLTETSKVPEELIQYLSSINQAVGGTLTDQNKNLVYYEKLLNKVEYDFIQSNQYYNDDVLSGLTQSLILPDYSIEIKAAWKILTDNDRKDRYYTIEAFLGQDNTKKTVGLVGLHIVYKTPNLPQWAWATFEQVDNLGGENGAAGAPYSFYDPSCAVSTCPPNQETSPGDPTQLTRLTKIRSSADSVNFVWQNKVKGTPFEFYQLISTQWPTDPKNPGNPAGSPTPTVLANSVLESYIQLQSSCMSCHGTARTKGGTNVSTDMSFLFLQANSPN